MNLALYLVLDPVQCGGHARAVEGAREALEGGVTGLQLLALELAPLPRRHGVPLVINDHLDVALAAGADGVHIGQRDLPPEVARKLLGAKALIGWSVSDARQTDEANRMGDLIDYVGVGPVFYTPTKPDAAAALGIDGL